MSTHISSMVWGMNWGTAGRKLIALKLADHAHDDGEGIYPSLNRVAAETELSRRYITKVVNDWVNIGLLILVKRGGKGAASTNVYAFDLELMDLAYEANISIKDCETYVEQGKNKGELSSYLRLNCETIRVNSETNKDEPQFTQTVNNRQRRRRRTARLRKDKTPRPASLVKIHKGEPGWQPWIDYFKSIDSPWQAGQMENGLHWMVDSPMPPVGPPGHPGVLQNGAEHE